MGWVLVALTAVEPAMLWADVAGDDKQRAPAKQPAADAAKQAGPPTALIQIKLPLSSGDDAPLKLALGRTRDRLVEEARRTQDARRPALVLEITPAPNAPDGGAGSEFETALSIARLLTSREMADVKTVAWLPRSLRGHGVLVAIACEEIMMPAEAELGEAGVDEPPGGKASATVVAAYREIAEAHRTIPTALAQGMIDAEAEVVAVDSEAGPRVLVRSEVKAFQRDHEVINERVLAPAGSLARITGREGRQLKVVAYLAADRDELARGLSVAASELEEDRSLLANWNPIILDIKGEITPRSASQLKSLLGTHVSAGANWVGVRIDSVGGDLQAALDLATTLASLEAEAVRTVAYVPVEARGAAAVVALACDQLVMHADATLGVGPDAERAAVPPPVEDNRRLPPPRERRDPRLPQLPFRDREVDLAAATATIRDSLAPRTERSWSLLAAMIDPGMEIFTYRNKATGEVRLMAPAEVAAMVEEANWTRGAPLGAANNLLSIDGRQAVAAGVAWHTVESFDQLKRLFGLDEVKAVEPNWALALVQALASPGLATFLLLLGFVGIYVELKTPGVGVGGVVAAIAFLLFFWSKYLDQTAEALEIVMFVAGIVLMLVEVFVLPGFGVFGLAGGLMVLFSLVLASQTFIVPHSQADLEQLRNSFAVVFAAGAGMVGLAYALGKVLPRAPVFNQMVLEPPPPEEQVTLSHREALADYSNLVGAEGEAVTDLRPTGKALIENKLVDVMAQGQPLDRGTPLIVVAAQANRVVVRRAT